MRRDIANARWWLAYPTALILLAILDVGLAFWRPFPPRLPEQFSSAYLRLYVSDAPSRKPVVTFLGDSVLWGYKIGESDTAVADLQRRFANAEMLNLSYEGGSAPNSAVMLRYVLRSGLRVSGVVVQVNVKEFNLADSSYRTLHPALEQAADEVLTTDDRRTLQMHAAADFNAKLGRFVEKIWRFYRLRTDLREKLFGTDDMAGFLAGHVHGLTGTKHAQELAHVPTPDKFLGTYDLAPIDPDNISMRYYRSLLQALCSAHIPALVFLTPTNHKLLHDYIDVPAYEANLHRLVAIPHCAGVTIVNFDRAISPKMFLDNDHLNADGQRVLASRLLGYVREMIR